MEAIRFAERVGGNDWSHLKLSANSSNGPKAVSLFSGCGGLTAGFTYAGFNVVSHVEIDAAARAVYQQNFPASRELGTDIRGVDDLQLEGLAREHGPIDVVFGGPPCQGFSLTGKRDVFDPRNQLYREFARVVKSLSPQVFVLENVRLITSMKTPDGSLLIEDLYEVFSRLGYSLTHAELNAMSFGVPQSRERAIFLGVKAGTKKPSLPAPTHKEADTASLFGNAKKPLLTVRDAFEGLEHLESGDASSDDPLHFAVNHPTHVIEMLRDVPEGKSAHENPDPSKRPTSGYNTTYKRMRWDEPASTVATTFGMISGSRNVHPVATRSLTIREATRCQTFADDFVFFGSLGDVRTMIGNAVPPRFGMALALHVKSLLLG